MLRLVRGAARAAHGVEVSRHRPLARKDSNHDEIANTFRGLGCSAIDTNLPPVAGYPDLVIGCMGVTHLVEAKSTLTAYGRAGLNDNQTAFARDWRGSPVHLVSSPDDAIALVKKWRAPK